jgi:hypothetical protein
MVRENHTRMPEVGKATSCSTGSTAATSSTGRERQPDANHEGVLAEQGRNRSLGAGARGGKLERRRRGIALLQDDLGRAADLYRETLTLSWETGVSPVVQRTLEGLACAAGQREKRSERYGCGERRRHFTKQRASQEIATSWPRLTLVYPPCAQVWARKLGRRSGERAGG